MRTIALMAAICWSAMAQPAITAVRNAASYSEAIAPGCWIAIFGTHLAPAPASAPTVPLPLSLGGVVVTVAGKEAPLLYVSATQINALVPFEAGVSESARVPVAVTTVEGSSAPFGVFLSRTAPALFTRDASGTGRAHVFDPAFRPVETVSAGAVLVLYAAGLGATSPPASSAAGGSAVEPFNRVVEPIEVYVGEQKAEVLFAGLAPGFPGVYQLNVRVPAVWTDRVYVRSGGWVSNIATVGIKPRNNVTDASAEFTGTVVDPSGMTVRVLSQRATIRFTIAPGAEPFLVAITGESGGVFVKVDPANRMQRWHSSHPAVPVWFGDFSALRFPVLDSRADCTPVPGNMVALARLDPAVRNLQYFLGPPDFVADGELAGAMSGVTELAASSGPMEINGLFADLIRVPCGADYNRWTKFVVYVDGRAIATQEAFLPTGP